MRFVGHSDNSESSSKSAQRATLAALEAAAGEYTAAGLSVIAVNTDTKRPLGKWQAAQQRAAGVGSLLKQVTAAHNLGLNVGLAVVLGSVSGRRIVLEFDNDSAAQEFAGAFPHLTNTYTVLSANRRLPHFHYIAPLGAPLSFTGAAGAVELRGAGQYVLMPPSTNENGTYTLINRAAAYALTMAEFEAMRRWVAGHTTARQKPATTRQKHAKTTPEAQQYTRRNLPAGNAEHMLLEVYEAACSASHSRNEALFQASLVARDSGMTRQSAAGVLIPLFVNTAAIGNHRHETPEQRQYEAARTINSAFSRPAGKPHKPRKHTEGLPNTAREKLLNSGAYGRALARILDCLYLAGAAGQWLTEAELLSMCKPHGIGRNTVRLALGMGNGGIQSEQKKCSVCVSFENKSLPPSKGRPRRAVRIPSRIEALRALDIPVTVATLTDALPAAGVGRKGFTARNYRARLIHALIERRPEQYTQKWLAARVGVKRRQTVSRYIVENVEIEVTRQLEEHALNWQSARNIPEDIGGSWIEFEGKRYPPRAGLALKLLAMARGRPVLFVRVVASLYRVRTLEEREAAALERFTTDMARSCFTASKSA